MPDVDPLLENNQAFAAAGGHEGVNVMPRHSVFVVSCLDPRTDPAGFLGVKPGDAMVVRNAGGRVTPTVLADVALIAQITELMMPGDGPLFEVAVVHHTQCGTGFLADDGFRRSLADRTGANEEALADQAVTDPERTVLHDVELLRSWTALSGRLTISGHVLDLDTGLVRTVLPASPMRDAGGAEQAQATA